MEKKVDRVGAATKRQPDGLKRGTISYLEMPGLEGGFVRMVKRLLEEGTLTGDTEADDFLRKSGEAVLLGLLYDQRIRAEYAFTGPIRLHQRLGHLDMGKISTMDLDRLRAVFAETPAVHRFTNRMSEYTIALARAVVDDYDGRAENIWSGNIPAREVEKRVALLPGFGKGKAIKSKYVLHYFGYRDFSSG